MHCPIRRFTRASRRRSEARRSEVRHASPPTSAQRYAKDLHDAARGVRGNEAILSVSVVGGIDAQRKLDDDVERLQRLESRHVVFDRRAGEREGCRWPPPRRVRLRELALLERTARCAGDRRSAAERTLARLGSKKSESAAMTVLVDNRSAGRLVSMLLAAAAGLVDPAEALVPREQARAAAVQSAADGDGRSADSARLRLAHVRQRRHRRQAATGLRQGRAEVVLHRQLLRSETADGADERLDRRICRGSSARNRSSNCWRTSRTACWSPASSAATPTPAPATSRSVSSVSAFATARSPSPCRR